MDIYKGNKEMQNIQELPVRLTKHTIKRLRERFGLDKNAAHRFAQKVAKTGEIAYNLNDTVKITHAGHSYIFAKTVDSKNNEDVLLMITALNEDKSREWNQYYRGEKRRVSTTKSSKIIRNQPIEKNRGRNYEEMGYFCA